jgi:hypothetical protein
VIRTVLLLVALRAEGGLHGLIVNSPPTGGSRAGEAWAG